MTWRPLGSELGAQAIRSWGAGFGDDWAKAFGSATLIGFVVMLMGARLAYAVTRADLYVAEPGLLTMAGWLPSLNPARPDSHSCRLWRF